MAVLNKGTTESGQGRMAKLSEAYERARAKKALPEPKIVHIEKDEEEIIARLKARRKASKSARL